MRLRNALDAVGDARIAAAVALAAMAAYLAFGWGEETAYDTHGRLAAAFLQGRWWLDGRPAWLTDLVACGEARWCGVGPPLPALLSALLLALGSTALAQGLVAQLLGGASAAPLYLGLRALGAPRPVALTGALVSAFGTTLLFSSADARSQYAAHSVAMLFTSIAFAVAARGGPAWGIGVAIGLAALARLPVAAAIPALALLASQRSGARYVPTLARVALGAVPLGLALAVYDLLRWGSPFELGYGRLAEGDVFFSQGLFSPLYLPRHLRAIFLEMPDLVADTPWSFRPRSVGMSLLLATPAFVWVAVALRRARADAVVGATALAAGLALLPDVLFGSTGGRQFGYRYSLDVQPFLVALALAGDARRRGSWRDRPSLFFLAATIAAIAVNAYAAIAILRFGWWQ